MSQPTKKARAPRPKKDTPDERAEKADARKRWSKVTVGDTGIEYRYNLHAVPVRVRALVAEQTGKSVEDLLVRSGSVSPLTYADIWWVTRLAAGERVTRRQVHDEWDERCPMVGLDDIEDVFEDHPEASAQPA